jgi:tellurite resistance protein TehA-like permease
MANNSNDLAAAASSPKKRVSVRERLVHFTWAWFDCTMSTGALASLLGQQPNTFPGLRSIGKVFFIVDIVLFVTLCILVTVRFTLHPRALAKSLHHPLESFYFGAFWVSIALILYCTQQYGVPSCGPWLVKTLEVCYWIYASCALLVAVFQYHVIFDEEKLPVFEAMPAWILPAYPFIVLGPLASVLLYSQPKTSAIPILISGIMFQGLGWTIALIMYTIYFTRLINSDIPEEPKRAGMYIAVGPAGM